MRGKTLKKTFVKADLGKRGGETRLPIYKTIKNGLRARIDARELPVGARIPSEQGLADEMGVSRGQARQALRDLEMEGYIERFPGRGSFVASEERRQSQSRSKRALHTVMLAYPVLARDNGSWYLRSMVSAFSEYIEEHGFHPVFYYTDYNAGAALRLLNRLEKHDLAGLVLWPQFRTAEDCLAVERVGESLFPCVLVDRYLPDTESDFVGTANRKAYDRLTAALMARGHRTIAYVARDFVDSLMNDRYGGYRHALMKAGVAVEERLVGVRREAPDPSLHYVGPDSTGEVLQRMFAKKPRPTAIVCSDDWTAGRVVTELGRLELRVPDDIALATIDDSMEPGRNEPRAWLTAVQDGPEIGRQAAQLLLTRIAEPATNGYEQRFVRPRYLFEESGVAQGNVLSGKEDGE